MDRHLAKYRYLALVFLLLPSAALADPLPARKVMNCSIPPSCGDINLNFANLWNVCGTKIAADNAPSLFSKVSGGDVTGAGGLRLLGNGMVIGRNSTSPIQNPGAFVIDHDSAKIELASGSGNIGRIDFSTLSSVVQWTIQRTAANHLDIDGPAANNVIIHNPQTYSDEARVYKNESIFIGTVAAAATADRIIAIPNDMLRTGGTFKLRVFVVPDGVSAVSAINFRYVWAKSGDAFNPGAATLRSWATFVSAVNVIYISEYFTFPTVPATGDKAIIIRFENGNPGAGVGYGNVMLEWEYKVDRYGLTTDN